MLEYKYDREADAIYITLKSDQYAYGIDLDDDRRIDYAANQQPIGIELLSVSRGVNLHNLPSADSVLEILNSEGIKSYRLIPYAYTISTSFIDIEPVALGIQFNLDADEEQDAYKGGIIKKELTGVS
jgi:uncharacterized protein YuzE